MKLESRHVRGTDVTADGTADGQRDGHETRSCWIIQHINAMRCNMNKNLRCSAMQYEQEATMQYDISIFVSTSIIPPLGEPLEPVRRTPHTPLYPRFPLLLVLLVELEPPRMPRHIALDEPHGLVAHPAQEVVPDKIGAGVGVRRRGGIAPWWREAGVAVGWERVEDVVGEGLGTTVGSWREAELTVSAVCYEVRSPRDEEDGEMVIRRWWEVAVLPGYAPARHRAPMAKRGRRREIVHVRWPSHTGPDEQENRTALTISSPVSTSSSHHASISCLDILPMPAARVCSCDDQRSEFGLLPRRMG